MDSPLSIAADDAEDPLLGPAGGAEDPSERGEGEGAAGEGGEGEVEDWDLEGAGAGDDMADVLFPEVEQDKMELLELEMRARAIKAMLALHEQREKDQRRRGRRK